MRTLPEAFLARLRTQLPSLYPALHDSLIYGAPSRGLRVNTLKLPDGVSPLSGLKINPLCPDAGYLLPETSDAGKHPYHAAGLYYLQEPSAQAVGAVCPVASGMRVLDLCAAPGGKSTHLSARLAHTGLLISNECISSRARILAGNLERIGARAYSVTTCMPDVLAAAVPGAFDLVLVDAPCSGEGMFRREPRAVTEWSPEHAAACALRGRRILDCAARLVSPGGTLVYSTCTYNPDENDGAITWLTETYPSFSVQTSRLLTPLDGGEGQYYAVLQNSDGVAGILPPCTLPSPDRAALAAFQSFWDNTFTIPPWYSPRILRDTVWLAPDASLPQTLAYGVAAGILRPGRFEPSHTLFLSIPAACIHRTLSFEPDDPALTAFFRGETLSCTLPAGYAAVCVNALGKSFPVGFGKVSGGILKNKLPSGLRIR